MNTSKLEMGQCVGLPNSMTSNTQKPNSWTTLHVDSIWKFVLKHVSGCIIPQDWTAKNLRGGSCPHPLSSPQSQVLLLPQTGQLLIIPLTYLSP